MKYESKLRIVYKVRKFFLLNLNFNYKFDNFNMEINQQKISQLVRRLSPADYKTKDIYNYNPLIKDFLSPKK